MKAPKEPQCRDFVIDRAAVKKDERTIEISFSSETPVERYWGVEILSHEYKACDLSRLKEAGPLLCEHDRNIQVGVVEDAWIDGKRRQGRARIRFGQSARAEDEWKDVQSGVRRNVSVTYEIHEMELTEKKDSTETYTVTRWKPIEVSLVSIAADVSVGVGRSQTHPTRNTPNMKRPLFNHHPSEGGGGPGEELENKREKKRCSQILQLAAQHRIETEIAQRFIDDDVALEDFQTWILQNRYKAEAINLPSPEIGMSKRDLRQYRVGRALHMLACGERADGLELEASREVAKRRRLDPEGIYIPFDIASRSVAEIQGLSAAQMITLAANIQRMTGMRSLTATVGSAGGFTVGTDVLGSSMIELLRNATTVLRLGATHLVGLQGNIAVPKQTGGATAYWLSEDGAGTPSDQTFSQLGLTPKRLCGLTKYSRQLLIQSSIDVEAFIRLDLMLVLAIAKDLAAIAGTGGAQPLGLLNTTGVNSITFGAAATWAKVVQMETESASDNAAFGSLAYLVTAATRGKWKTNEAFSSTGITIWDRGAKTVNGYPAEVTEQLPSNRVVFGNWRDVIVADWDAFDVVVDKYSLADQGLSRVVINSLTDTGVRHAESFCVSSDSGAQ